MSTLDAVRTALVSEGLQEGRVRPGVGVGEIPGFVVYPGGGTRFVVAWVGDGTASTKRMTKQLCSVLTAAGLPARMDGEFQVIVEGWEK